MAREIRDFPKDLSKKGISAKIPNQLFQEIYKFVYNEFSPFENMTDFYIDALIYSLESWDGYHPTPETLRAKALAKLQREEQEAMVEETLYLKVRGLIAMGNFDKAREAASNLSAKYKAEIQPLLKGK